MKTLDGHGDDYRNAQLTILLEVSISWTAEQPWLQSIFFSHVSSCSSSPIFKGTMFFVQQNVY